MVGAGFSGAVLARELAEKTDGTVLVLDARDHIGGNCHTTRDPETGVMVHRYGPHIFNTNSEKVWNYVNRFGDFRPFINRVKAHTERGIFSLPINLLTINQFFGKTMNPAEAHSFLAELGDNTLTEPKNFEEQALKMVGRDLYETFFKGYTVKQWGCDPKDLPAAVLNRLPVRFTYDDNYYDKRFQGIPAKGYTEVIRNILDHPRIEVRLNEKFDPSLPSTPVFAPPPTNQSATDSTKAERPGFQPRTHHLFYTGPIDAFFGYSEGRLGYRTVTFERIKTDASDYQGNAVINYPGLEVPFTRVHEHKHFAPWETHTKTVAYREFSRETGPNDIPYYPKRLASDKKLLQIYRTLAEQLPGNQKPNGSRSGEIRAARLSTKLQRMHGNGQAFNQEPETPPPIHNPSSIIHHPKSALPTSFLGRLATYRYMDMEAVIGEALDFAQTYIEATEKKLPLPVFPNAE